MAEPIVVGVLALQGDFHAHRQMLESLGAEVREVRKPSELEGLAGLVIPGGESTALLRLLDHQPTWWEALPELVHRGAAVFGTCAGLILLAREVTGPTQRSLGLLDVTVARNAYGRQVDSFETQGRFKDGEPLEMVFIRAPRITRTGPGVTVVAEHEGEPVLVEEGHLLAATFHPELTHDPAAHRRFLELARASASVSVESR